LVSRDERYAIVWETPMIWLRENYRLSGNGRFT
jgi:hypothetical protein